VDGGAFGPVEHPELDAGAVGATRHLTAKRVEFPDKMAFACSTDIRVARHIAHGVKVYRKAYGFHSKARNGERRLDPGMPRANYGNVILPRLECQFIPLSSIMN